MTSLANSTAALSGRLPRTAHRARRLWGRRRRGRHDTAATSTAAESSGGDATAGEEVWTFAGCGACHTLAAAGSEGQLRGPNLDDLQPDFDTVVRQVTNGGGGMPAFSERLTEDQIQDVAAYVSENAGG